MTVVKICGITDPEDVRLLAKYPVTFVGMIFHPSSRCYIEKSVAKEIVEAAREYSFAPVGVFVDQGYASILDYLHELHIDTLQLHGDNARKAFTQMPSNYVKIYVQDVALNGKTITEKPPEESFNEEQDWILCDGLKSDTQAFDWTRFSPPQVKKWLLAGKLNPQNISQALNLLHPTGVDVNSGICHKNSSRKDPSKLGYFFEAIRTFEAAYG